VFNPLQHGDVAAEHRPDFGRVEVRFAANEADGRGVGLGQGERPTAG
jgi:hypothetical protein